MAGATAGGIRPWRVLAVTMFATSALCLMAAVAASPPVLRAFILVDADSGGRRLTTACLALSLCALAGAAGSGWLGTRLWRRADRISGSTISVRLLATLIGLAGYLLLMEVGVRVVFEPADILSGNAFWVHRWLQRDPDEDVVFRRGNPINRHDAELGWVPIPGHASELYHVNSLGARGAAEFTLAKPPGEKRIVVVGDSFTFGEGVADDDVYTAILQEEFEGVRVINLGVLGYGTDQQYLRLRRDGFAFDPDLVILAFFGTNAERNVLTFRDSAKPMFRAEGNGLRLVNVPVSDPADPSTDLGDPTPLLRLGALAGTLWSRALSRTRFAPRWEITRRILDAAVEACRARDVPFLLLFFPEKRASFWDTPHDTEIVLGRWAEERRVRFLSVRPAFLRLTREDRRRVWYGHYTPFGNRVVASAIAEEIRAWGILGE